VVVHAFNPSTWEAEAGRALSLRPVWTTELVPGQPGLHRKTLPQKTKMKQIINKTNKQTNKQEAMK
jgi:ABC-type phosphate/phosphonate transport system substrate-binding protein